MDSNTNPLHEDRQINIPCESYCIYYVKVSDNKQSAVKVTLRMKAATVYNNFLCRNSGKSASLSIPNESFT